MDDFSKIQLVSIIIPSYNAKPFLQETIKSVLNQTYKAIEIILVDDGSIDGTEKLFPLFEKNGIICRSQPNKGAAAARNLGLSIAKGDYIQFLDADDLLHPNKLEVQVNQMELQKADLSMTFWSNFSTTTEMAEPFKFRNLSFSSLQDGKDILRSFGMNNWFVVPIAWLTRRELLEKAGFWNEHISNNDDGEYFARVLFHASKVICIDEVLGYYRTTVSSNSLSKLNSESKINSAFESYQLIEKLLQEDIDSNLMSYPKRLYYAQYKMIHDKFPVLSKRTAIAFDRLKVDCFLTKEEIWPWLRLFGLRKGINYFKRYNSLKKRVYKKLFKIKSLIML